MRRRPGRPHPLGATWDGEGVNFALFSERATGVDLCLFDGAGTGRESRRFRLEERTDHVWHVYLPEIRPGQYYGYRVHGQYDPDAGLRFNSHKLLLDPYAKALAGELQWSDRMFSYRIGDPSSDFAKDLRDNAGEIPKCVVVDQAFTWGPDRPLKIPWEQTVIYELHVKGFTIQNPDVPEAVRGSYEGLASPAVIDYLQALGVTAVELLPVHAFVTDRHLHDRGLVNYWGYNTIGFFAPDSRYALSGDPGRHVREFKTMVKTLHSAGIEVILDVVYNHTAEGNHLGPTLSFRGIDNHAYYRLIESQPRYYEDFTGCGNSLNVRHPRTLQLIMDSLRYWVCEMHVDGFRFDLATTLARESHGVDRLSAFFDIIQQDPVLSQVKLIAEPWDLGHGGYQVGNFPPGWAEWNGRYRDTVRRYWRGDGGQISEFASRLTGSSDLYQASGRTPFASVNFVTAHDGFTLHDLVSYNMKHNEGNHEGNRDGSDENYSWNCGAEGPTSDPMISSLRERQERNLLATLFFSQGVPMLCAGDELRRTQLGNNNAYCQDNEISWIDWNVSDSGRALWMFTRTLIALRRAHPVMRRRRFYQGKKVRGSEVKDLAWFRPDGKEMRQQEWETDFIRCLGLRLAGDAIEEMDDRGQLVHGETLLLLLNAHHEEVPFILPSHRASVRWDLILDTAEPSRGQGRIIYKGGDCYQLTSRSLVLFQLWPDSR
jgi:glycogen operon protein